MRLSLSRQTVRALDGKQEQNGKAQVTADCLNVSLRAELAITRTELGAALAECGRPASMACRHPAGAVDGGTCRACGTEVW